MDAAQTSRDATAAKKGTTPKKRTTLDTTAEILERNPPKQWRHVRATLIDCDGKRYEIAEEGPGYILCHVKLPSPEMSLIGCDSCSGPHQTRNAKCGGNTNKWRSPPPATRLFDFKTNTLYPYHVISSNIEWNGARHTSGRVVFATKLAK
jgi:hypothetical protein